MLSVGNVFSLLNKRNFCVLICYHWLKQILHNSSFNIISISFTSLLWKINFLWFWTHNNKLITNFKLISKYELDFAYFLSNIKDSIKYKVFPFWDHKYRAVERHKILYCTLLLYNLYLITSNSFVPASFFCHLLIYLIFISTGF